MKKLLLLLMLPVCVLGQEDKKPRKLFLELKQGVGLPSIGGVAETTKGNYWSVGVNASNTIFLLPELKRFIYKVELGPYVSHTIVMDKNLLLDIGVSTIIDSDFGGFISYLGLFYEKKLMFGFNLGVAHMDKYDEWQRIDIEVDRWQCFLVLSPLIKFRL